MTLRSDRIAAEEDVLFGASGQLAGPMRNWTGGAVCAGAIMAR